MKKQTTSKQRRLQHEICASAYVQIHEVGSKLDQTIETDVGKHNINKTQDHFRHKPDKTPTLRPGV